MDKVGFRAFTRKQARLHSVTGYANNQADGSGGFGTPTIFVNGDLMFFGNDRLVLVEEELKRSA